jgi:hypothetical protein
MRPYYVTLKTGRLESGYPIEGIPGFAYEQEPGILNAPQPIFDPVSPKNLQPVGVRQNPVYQKLYFRT